MSCAPLLRAPTETAAASVAMNQQSTMRDRQWRSKIYIFNRKDFGESCKMLIHTRAYTHKTNGEEIIVNYLQNDQILSHVHHCGRKVRNFQAITNVRFAKASPCAVRGSIAVTVTTTTVVLIHARETITVAEKPLQIYRKINGQLNKKLLVERTCTIAVKAIYTRLQSQHTNPSACHLTSTDRA